MTMFNCPSVGTTNFQLGLTPEGPPRSLKFSLSLNPTRPFSDSKNYSKLHEVAQGPQYLHFFGVAHEN